MGDQTRDPSSNRLSEVVLRFVDLLQQRLLLGRDSLVRAWHGQLVGGPSHKSIAALLLRDLAEESALREQSLTQLVFDTTIVDDAADCLFPLIAEIRESESVRCPPNEPFVQYLLRTS